MKRRRLAGVLSGLLLMTAAFSGSTGASGQVTRILDPLTPAEGAPAAEGALTDETPQLWFVELKSPPAAEGGSQEILRKEKESFRQAAQQTGIQFAERFQFNVLFQGISVKAAPSQVPALARLPGVKSLRPVHIVRLPKPEQLPGADLESAVAMTGADIVQSKLGFTGKGIKVAVMDTGIDYNHPDLGGCFGPGCRVAMGWDFVGDDFDPTFSPTPAPDADPDDCNGHGTHVAGIVGANGKVKGVAPEVTFGSYRVFGCGGSTTDEVMLAAMERALADGMQVLNMSIGSSFEWPQSVLGLASDRLVKKGMVVVSSIGNSGAAGLYSAGAPGVGTDVIGVASFDNSHLRMSMFMIGGTEVGFTQAVGAPAAPVSGSLPMARTGTPATANDACVSLEAGSLTGKVALIRRGSCPFYTKAMNAQNAGAAGVVIYSNVPGALTATVAGSPAVSIPVVTISDVSGADLNRRLDAGSVSLTWTDKAGLFPNPTGGLISSFSSYGLAPDLALKPDIGAPGGLIHSTFPLEQGGYATLSGTSMSSPHVAGSVALLLQAQPNTRAAQVRTILQNSAEPHMWWGSPALGFPDSVHRQGAGMLRIDRAILATTLVEPGKFSLGESQAGPAQRELLITNTGPETVTYDLGHQPALATDDTFSPRFWTGFADVAYSASSVTLRPGARTKVRVTITAPADLPDSSIYGGYLTVTPRGRGLTATRVPYAGFKGDYQAIQAMAPTIFGLPWMIRLSDRGLERPGDGAVFTMEGSDVPFLLFHLQHQVEKLQLEVHGRDGKNWKNALELDHFIRSSGPFGFFLLAFDGNTVNGNNTITVPDGEYTLVLKAVKALGKESNPDDVETWTSPVFTIKRP